MNVGIPPNFYWWDGCKIHLACDLNKALGMKVNMVVQRLFVVLLMMAIVAGFMLRILMRLLLVNLRSSLGLQVMSQVNQSIGMEFMSNHPMIYVTWYDVQLMAGG